MLRFHRWKVTGDSGMSSSCERCKGYGVEPDGHTGEGVPFWFSWPAGPDPMFEADDPVEICDGPREGLIGAFRWAERARVGGPVVVVIYTPTGMVRVDSDDVMPRRVASAVDDRGHGQD